jgi:hypothetical protein
MDFFGFGKRYGRGTRSNTHRGLDFTTGKRSKDYDENGHRIKKNHKPFSKRGGRKGSTKGTRSRTRPGRINYMTHEGDSVFHQNGHYVRKDRTPYSKRKLFN